MNLRYFADTAELLRRLAPLGDVSVLDSADSERGYWDVIVAAPAEVRVLESGATASEIAAFVAALLQWEAQLPAAAADELPFHGGLVGFFSYELGRRLQGLEPSPRATQPLAVIREHRWALLQHRPTRTAHFVNYGDTGPAESAVAALLDGPGPPPPVPLTLDAPFGSPWDFAAYRECFRRVQSFITAGDCYQMNLGQPFSARYHGDLEDGYRRLRAVAQAPFSAFFRLDANSALLSLSPERFLTVRDRQVDTHPIKGTRPRAADRARDSELAAELLASEKERAENLMIVDLLRNDISRFCRTGSVSVEQLFDVESYSTVHHLVSHVRGHLRDAVTPLELLLGCLPGGSITGAPKHRAMQLIDELEPAARESWCGSLFLRSRCGRMDSNILIRTLYGDSDTLTCWAGGGLVADSLPEAEFAELEHKVGALLRALG